MGIRRVVWTLILLLVFSSTVLAAELPTRLKDIPIYPGAVRDPELETEYLDYTWVSEDVVFREVRAYRIDGFIDDVARFYLDRFQPELGWPEEDPYFLDEGESLGPWYEPDFYSPSIFEDQYDHDTLIYDGKWVRKAFAERPMWEENKWLAQVWIEWAMVNEDYELIDVSIMITDEGYDGNQRIDFKSTRLVIEMTVTDRGMMWDGDWDEEWDDDWFGNWDWMSDWNYEWDDDEEDDW